MQRNGWIIDVKKSMDPRYSNSCGKETWYGYSPGGSIGSVKTRFRGNGAATLNFGNCYGRGRVIVYLNDDEISRAYKNTKKMEVTFEYFQGDRLSIKEFSSAIIKLNSLTLRNQGKKRM